MPLRSVKIELMQNMQSGNPPRGCGGGGTTLRFVSAILVLIGILAPEALRQREAFALSRSSNDYAPKHETRKATGVVTGIQARQVTLQSKDGGTLVLATFEDYRDRVAVGSQVTALYYPQDNGNPVLKSLDYPVEMLFVAAGEITGNMHRIILLPNSQVADVDAFYEAVRDYLHTRFGWYVAPSYLAKEVRRRSQQSDSMLSAMDPRTGSFDMTAYLSKSQSAMADIASATRSDAVLELDVIQVEAPVSRLEASWDGVEEPVAGTAARTLAKVSVFSRHGEVPAATVELKLWGATGKLLWRNRRGLALLQVMNGRGTLEDRPLPAALSDTPRVQRWMAAVFKSLEPKAAPAPAP
ncbi:MAG TPA: hypothetical protein VGZ29_01530 [Terriglobia bacterium]|nr:hypothetical protein [Terriglobia bacterium]